eukprot:47474-Pelagomonas_calceolata.AAC.1
MLNKLQDCAIRKCLTVITKKYEVVRFKSRADTLPQLLYDGDSFPYTDSFKDLGMVCDKRLNVSTAAETALKPCTSGTYCVQAFANDHNLTNWLHALIWFLKYICYPSRHVCQPDMGHSLLTARHKNGQSATEVDSERFAEPSWG